MNARMLIKRIERLSISDGDKLDLLGRLADLIRNDLNREVTSGMIRQICTDQGIPEVIERLSRIPSHRMFAYSKRNSGIYYSRRHPHGCSYKLPKKKGGEL